MKPDPFFEGEKEELIEAATNAIIRYPLSARDEM